MDPQSATSGPAGLTRGQRVSLGFALVALLGGVFFLYSNPQLVIMLTDQLWACF
jgi:hypothetical protein